MSDNTTSAEYGRFLASVEGVDPKFREELDMDALLALKDEERRAAEELLVERVKNEDDWRVPPVLAALRVKRSVRPMNERLPKTKGRMRVALARALVELGALEALAPTVIAMLDGKDPEDGIPALAAADDLPRDKPLIDALGRASVHHPVPEVRINAGAGLLQMAKLTRDPLVWEFRPLYLLLGEEDEKVRREALEAICEITQLPPQIAD